ncbi:uncharacterized protein [Lolium perenne]|uniref:uncharacterized protein isoform X1 n=1 Tax=Lolium perenne TaxID=4522 RepID=UPI0021F5187A|nr:uncharacterized protein LOC127300568 isoform X1 [Lolium perenne]XP_051186667.1 uncharacterized protein LOC127300568 isoform X1 [Lolium perenne]
MGNSCATGGNSVLLETHEPDFKWKIHGFSAHLLKGAISSYSSWFDCCGYKWYLVVNPSHKIVGAGTPQVAVCLGLVRTGLKPDHFISAVFELSMYNHSNGTYCGRKASDVFDVKKARSDRKCLIPLAELLNSSEFLVDDSCIFGVKILAANFHSLKMKHTPLVHQNRTTTTQNLFLRKEGFIKGTYTWSMTDFIDLALKPSVLSPVFEVGGYKWNIKMYPRGNECSTRSMSLYLHLHSPDELPRESGRMIELTLTILNQKYIGERYSYKRQGRLVFVGMNVWGWPNFIPRKTLKSKSGGYLVGSNCIVKADISIIGSSSESLASVS